MARALSALTLLVLLLFSERAIAQREYDIWHFGQGFTVDFRGGAPALVAGSAIWTGEGSASMCDRQTGALLFYTDGVTVYNRNHAAMPNGTGLNGHFSSTQSALIVPMPGDPTRYYIFTSDQEAYAGPPNRGISYSIVDMARNGGRGDVTSKNVLIQGTAAEKLTAIPHTNGSDYWVIYHSLGGNTFYAHQVSAAGVSMTPVISTVGASQGNPPVSRVWTIGYLKASPDGRKLVSVCEGLGLVELFDFSPCSGVISNAIQLNATPADGPYGASFSPDNSKLYVAYRQLLYQYELQPYVAGSIIASRMLINDAANPPGEVFGAMQLGPDGRIYVVGNSNWLGAINNPNVRGQGCNYVTRTLRVSTFFGAFWLGLPNNIDGVRQGGGPPPGVQITPSGPTTFCQGDSVRLTAPGGYRTYQWSSGESTLSIAAKKDGIYTVSVTDSSGCTDMGTITIRVRPLPVPTITPSGPTSICEGDSVTLTTNAGYVSYRWSNGGVTRSITVGASGRYMVTVTDSSGCTGTASINVDVSPKPAPAISGPSTFCNGDSALLDGGAGYVSYLWSTGATTQTIRVGTGGSYSVRVTDSRGCSAESAPFDVKELPIADATITPVTPAVFCEGDSTILGSVPGHRSYRWSNGETGRRIVVRTPGRYSLTVVDTNGCTATSSIDVAMQARPTATITHARPLTFCEGDSVELDAGAGFASYRWSTGERSQRIVVRETGLYTVAVTNTSGCADTAEAVSVVATPMPDATINGPTTLCPNGTGVYSVTPLAGGAYQWTVNGAGGSIIAGAGTNSITVRWGASGTGVVSVSLTSPLGCSAMATRQVTLGTELVPVVTTDRAPRLCAGDTVTLDAGNYQTYRWSTGETTRTIRVDRPGVYTVTVTDGGCSGASEPVTVVIIADPVPVISTPDGRILCQGDSVALDAGPGYARYFWSNGARTQKVVVHDAGAYTVRVVDSSGCSGTSEAVTIDVQAKPAPRISGAEIVCRNSTTTYSAADQNGRSYDWRVSGGTIISGEGTGRVEVKWGTGPAGFVELTETLSSLGCFADAPRFDVAIGDSIRPTITPSDSATLCEGSSVSLDAGEGYARYSWSNGASTRVISVSDAGPYTVTVDAGDGCSGSATTVVRVRQRPMPRIWPSGTIRRCLGDSVLLEAPPGYVRYLWSNGAQEQAIMVKEGGIYTVEVTDANGCSGGSGPVVVIFSPGPDKPVISKSSGELRSTPAENYQWSFNNVPIIGATGQTLADPIPGVYRVTVYDSLGCTTISDPFDLFFRHAVSLDTVYAVVGDRMLLTMRVDPPIDADAELDGYEVKLRLEPKSIYPHRVISPDRDQHGELASMQVSRDGAIVISRSSAGASLTGNILFQLEFEGLITGQPLNPVLIERITSGSDLDFRVAGNGLVILSGCAITHQNGFGKSIWIEGVSPSPAESDLRVEYVAPAGAVPLLRMIDLTGADAASMQLEPGTGGAQNVQVDVTRLPSGIYMLELRDGVERSVVPVIIRR